MLTSNPPEHTRLRALVSKAFTPRSVRELAPRIQQIVDDLLDAAEADGGMDAVSQFAYPLPITVIAELLGVEHGPAGLLSRGLAEDGGRDRARSMTRRRVRASDARGAIAARGVLRST